MQVRSPAEIARESAVSDDDLVLAVRETQDSDALAALQERYGRRVFHFVRGLLRDGALAQEVAQEVFEKVFLKAHLYSPGTNFRAWLFEVARNQALSALRSRRRHPQPISDLHRDGDDDSHNLLENLAERRVDRSLEEREFLDAFHDAVEQLPDRYRDVFDLCVRQGRPYQEAADKFDLPTGTVAIRIMRARKRLFKALGHHIGRLRRPPACFQ